MCIYLSHNTIFVLIFIAGLVLGAFIHRIVARPKKPSEPIDYYDGTHGMGYQPLPSSQPPKNPPKSLRPPPPKPLHNPHK